MQEVVMRSHPGNGHEELMQVMVMRSHGGNGPVSVDLVEYTFRHVSYIPSFYSIHNHILYLFFLLNGR